jgi:hypothetical protein
MGFGYWQMAITDLYADRYPEALENAQKAMQSRWRRLIISVRASPRGAPTP